METSDVIAVAGATISTFLTVYVIYFTRSQNKKNTLLHMHQIWSSEFYRKCRVRTYTEIRKHNKKQGKIKYSEIKFKGFEMELGTVEHFFSDIHNLLITKSIEKQLCKRFFSEELHRWTKEIFSEIDYDAEGEKEFFESNLKPLYAMICESKR